MYVTKALLFEGLFVLIMFVVMKNLKHLVEKHQCVYQGVTVLGTLAFVMHYFLNMMLVLENIEYYEPVFVSLLAFCIPVVVAVLSMVVILKEVKKMNVCDEYKKMRIKDL